MTYQQGFGVSTNIIESFFSRVRRSYRGIHHRFSLKYMDWYAAELAWREDRPADGYTPLVANSIVAVERTSADTGEGWRFLFTDFLTRSKAAASIAKVSLVLFATFTNGSIRPRSCRVLMHLTKSSTDATLSGLADADRAVAPLDRLVKLKQHSHGG
ncbi:hypothetical protein V1281_001504 [Nitrobacteraceae bacterium AZCC 2161]